MPVASPVRLRESGGGQDYCWLQTARRQGLHQTGSQYQSRVRRCGCGGSTPPSLSSNASAYQLDQFCQQKLFQIMQFYIFHCLSPKAFNLRLFYNPYMQSQLKMLNSMQKQSLIVISFAFFPSIYCFRYQSQPAYLIKYYITSFLMESYRLPLEFVSEAIEKGFSRTTCSQIHGGSCNAFCLNYVWRVAGNTYKTYGAVYLVQLLFKIRKMSKNPVREGLKFLFDYVKSTSLTAVEMMLMRRILCLLCNHYRNGQNNLIPANFLSAFYILVESPSRQAEISLYQLSNTMFILYKMAERRGMVKALPRGECLLFAVAVALACFHFFDNPEAFRKSYIQSILNQLLREE